MLVNSRTSYMSVKGEDIEEHVSQLAYDAGPLPSRTINSSCLAFQMERANTRQQQASQLAPRSPRLLPSYATVELLHQQVTTALLALHAGPRGCAVAAFAEIVRRFLCSYSTCCRIWWIINGPISSS